MPGVIVIPLGAPIGKMIEDLLIVFGASEAEDHKNQVLHLPLTPSNP
jgi:hypothetical protein